MTAVASLLAHWHERDQRYGVRRHLGDIAPLTEAEQSSIRAYRYSEVLLLPEKDQPRALAALTSWTAPVIKEFAP